MDKRKNEPKMNLQTPKNQSKGDKFIETTSRKTPQYDKHRPISLRRNESYSSSASDLEAETGFKVDPGSRTCTRSQAIRRVFDRSKSPIKRKSASPMRRGRKTGKINCKIASSLGSYKIYRGYCRSARDYYREGGSEDSFSDSSSSSSCSTLGHGEDINTSFNVSYQGSYDMPKQVAMDSLHIYKSTNQENHRACPLQGRKNQENHLDYDDYIGTRQGELKEEDQSLKKRKENHVSLSTKYRPRSFKDLVGQEIVKKSLMNAQLKRKIAPVYLFYGPRGTGKTSAARIFASALNCLSPNLKSKPCCKCRECLLFLYGKSPHITELSATGSDGNDRLKLCMENIQVSCLASGYRIFIVEDCHELTPQAWSSAMLRCMQNSMGHVLFILITIDSEWVPKAALSRCQKFCFQKLRDVDVFNRLRKLAAAENIDIEEDALHLITARGGGSLRDAEAAVEQFSLLSSKLTLSSVRRMIGLIPHEKLLDLLDFALSADTENIVKCMQEIIDSGVKPLALVSQLATLVMDILATRCFSEDAQDTQNFFGRPQSSEHRTEKLGRALKILAEAEKQLRASNECISWLTASLLQFGTDELTPNPHPAVSSTTMHTNMGEIGPDYAEETCQHIDYWNVYEVPDKIFKVRNTEAIAAKDSGFQSSFDTGACFAESPMNPFCKLDASKLVHSHDSTAKKIPITFPNGPSEVVESELNPTSPCEMEEIWEKVLKSTQSATLEDLLQGQGKLVSLLLCKANARAIAHVEFRHNQQNIKFKRLEVGICNALQEALGCPVEVKMMLAPPSSDHANAEESINADANNSKDTLYCQEIKTSKSTFINHIVRLAQKHFKWRKINFGFQRVCCARSGCICLSPKRCIRLCAKRCLCMEY